MLTNEEKEKLLIEFTKEVYREAWMKGSLCDGDPQIMEKDLAEFIERESK